MATKTTTTRTRSTTPRKTTRRRTSSASTAPRATPSLAAEAKTAVRSVRTRAARAAKKIPTDRNSIGIAAGLIAGIVAAGVAIFMNRDRLRVAATTGGEKLKQAADDLSTMAHERIDQARDNITKFRSRNNGSGVEQSAPESIAING